MDKLKTFISYAHEDKEFADELSAFLDKSDVTVFIDHQFKVNDPIPETIRENVHKSDFCIWILTKNSLKSKWCPYEVGAFWGSEKPVIIYNPSKKPLLSGPLFDRVHAEGKEDLLGAIKEIRNKLNPSNRSFGSLSVQQARKIFREEIGELDIKIESFQSTFEKVKNLVEEQNVYLEGHVKILGKITEILKNRPEKIRSAFDVPSFGSLSAEAEYIKCRTAFSNFCETAPTWDMQIMLLPADIGAKITKLEYPLLEKREKAWHQDLEALKRFDRYRRIAEERNSNFEICWLGVERDKKGVSLGVHSMPLNLWVFDGKEAVFSTVIDNYRPILQKEKSQAIAAVADEKTILLPELPKENVKPRLKEIGFYTSDRDMVRFLEEIFNKYKENIDENMTLANQITASEIEWNRIKRSRLRVKTNNRNDK